jgi:hypothetical protein
VIREDDHVEADSDEYPSLAGLCHSLVRYVNHRDKEVRLYTISTCMELFTVYAPEAPWEPSETLEIFRQTIRQLANLAHTTTTKQPHFYDYYRVLELLAEVKIGVLLVDLFKIQDDDDDDDNDNDDDDVRNNMVATTKKKDPPRRHKQKQNPKKRRNSVDNSCSDDDTDGDDDEILYEQQHPIIDKTTKKGQQKKKKTTSISEESLQVLTELFRTLLQSVRTEHPSEISDFCQKTLVSCVEEFYESTIVPIPILDEILVCLGQGPRVLVLQLQQQQQAQPPSSSLPPAQIGNKSKTRKGSSTSSSSKSPTKLSTTSLAEMGSIPQYVQQINPSYLVASAVIRRTVDRLSTPIATLLNGLINSDPRSMGQSTISNNHHHHHRLDDDGLVNDHEREDYDNDDGTDDDSARILAALEIVKNLGKPQRQQQDTHHTSNVWSIICELQRVAPTILTTVIGNLTSHVDTTDVAHRMLVVQTLGKLFVGGGNNSSSTTTSSSISSSTGDNISTKGMSSNSRDDTQLQLARQYNPSYRKWLQRSGDRRVEIRQIMLPHLLTIASKWQGGKNNNTHDGGGSSTNNYNNQPQSLTSELAHEAQCALLERLEKDPSADFRIEVIHGLCNLLNNNSNDPGATISNRSSRHIVLDPKLMIALGVRVTSKHRVERKTALTGLVQVYHRQYIRHHLSTVLEGGDDCPIEAVLEVLHECCPMSVTQQQQQRDTTSTKKRGRRSTSTPSKRKQRSGQRKRRVESDDDDDDDVSEGGESDREGFRVQYDEVGTYYQWIPSKMFEAASYTDAADSEMHSRVITLMDDVILGSELPHSNNKIHLTSTARAVGLAIVVDTIHSHYPLASHWMSELLHDRAKLQTALKAYLDARGDTRALVTGTKIRVFLLMYFTVTEVQRIFKRMIRRTITHIVLLKHTLTLLSLSFSIHTGTEEYFISDFKAKDLLEKVASMIPALPGASPTPGERHAVLEKFHGIKDNHVFRILGTLVHSDHSIKSRIRALDDLQKRVKSTAGDAVQTWVRLLVKRCSMGDFLNLDIIQHCSMLALECFEGDQLVAAQKFLSCVQLAANSFPILCASKEVYENLTTIFRDCSNLPSSASKRKKIEQSNIVTTVSAILASVSPFRIASKGSIEVEDLQEQLIRLCQNGTPEQARHAVATIAALLVTKEDITLTQEQEDTFLPLLQTLASPSRLAITATGTSSRLACVLVSLAELADRAPGAFDSSERGKNALKFAVDRVLLGRAYSASTKKKRTSGLNEDRDENDSSEGESESDGEETKTPARQRRKSAKSTNDTTHLSPVTGTNLVEDHNLSISCRTLCAAIEFLSTYIRSSFLTNKSAGTSGSALAFPTSHDFIDNYFSVLSQILRDQGMPPSSRDRQLCCARQDRAALRQCAAIHLLRLCDTRLGLDQKYLTTQRWHFLSYALLDDERVVRTAVMQELGLMFTGNGVYGNSKGVPPMAPRLRFLAFLVLCTDGDHGADHTRANGNAANVGKCAHNAKGNAASSIAFLRRIYESHSSQARAKGPDAEKHFELHTKLTIMPECMVPYAYHLLSFRGETPSVNGNNAGDGSTEEYDDGNQIEESCQRVLRKRLKLLFDPLVQTLGDSADNISFLLRITDVISKSFQLEGFNPSSGGDSSPGSNLLPFTKKKDGAKHHGKLLNVCTSAREVLLSYVKKDVNLETHPGTIRMPVNLFRKRSLKQDPTVSARVVSTGGVSPRDVPRDAQSFSIQQEENNEASPFGIDSTVSSASNSHRKASESGEPMPKEAIAASKYGKTSDFPQDEDIPMSDSPWKESRRRSKRNSGTLDSQTTLNSEKLQSVGTDSGSKRTRRQHFSPDQSSGTQSIPNHTPARMVKNSLTPTRRASDGRVRFSTRSSTGTIEKSYDFDDLSPIKARPSLADASNNGVLGSGDKTRGTTPPSSIRKMSGTTSLDPFESPNSPTPVSESPSSKYASLKSADQSNTSRQSTLEIRSEKKSDERASAVKKPSNNRQGKENDVKATTKKGKKSIPQQIKIVRIKPKRGLNIASEHQPNRQTRSRQRKEQSKVSAQDSFAFDG